MPPKMSNARKQVANQAASEIVNAFKALRKDGVPPKRALELAQIRARHDAEERAAARTEFDAAWSRGDVAVGARAAASTLNDLFRSVWPFVKTNAPQRADPIGAIAGARFRDLMVLNSRNPRDRVHAQTKGQTGYLRIDFLDQESDFVIKDWLWNLFKAFRQEAGRAEMPSDGLARLNGALEFGFSLASRWNAGCWGLRLAFNGVEKDAAAMVSGLSALVSARPQAAGEDIPLPSGRRTQKWEPGAHRTILRQTESRDGRVEVTVYIDARAKPGADMSAMG